MAVLDYSAKKVTDMVHLIFRRLCQRLMSGKHFSVAGFLWVSPKLLIEIPRRSALAY